LALLLCPALSVAQSLPAPSSRPSETIDEVRKNARVHVGPFYLTPAIRLKELGVDTNVFNDGTGGDPRSDFMFNVSPQADLWMPIARRALFSVAAATDLVWYAEYTTERSIDPQFTARGELYLNRLTFFAGNAYLNTRQRTNYEIDLRSRSVLNDAQAGVAYRVTPKFSVEVAGRRGVLEYDAEDSYQGVSLQESMNRDTRGVSVAAKHKLTPLTTLVARVDRFTEAFPFSPERDSTSLKVMPGVEFKPRALISGSAYVGFRRFTPDDEAALPEYTGVIGQVGLSWTLKGSTTFGVNFSRDVSYSFEPTQPYYVSNSIGAAVRRALGRRFDVIVSGDRHVYDYRELQIGLPVVPEEPAGPRVDTTWVYAGSLGYRLGPANRIGFGVSYWQRESTTAKFRNYEGLRIGSTVTYGF
jgi:hypothetical protein